MKIERRLCVMKRIILNFISIFLFLFACAGTTRAENVGVPSECEDVMLQAFYWDSYKTQSGSNSKYGRTKWIDLRKDTAAINASFDLVWLPPSAYGDGGDGNGGVGYIPKNFTNQTSDWGQQTTLVSLISAFHRAGTRVIADIVINHHGNMTSWCNFFKDNFGSFGTFQLESKHICKYDEGFTDPSSGCYGSSDRGGEDTGPNCEGARDLDHKNEYVQNWSKAYLQWMLSVMKYDGFRYDMTRGFAGKYLKMYNEASNPYLSVSEFWMDDIKDPIEHLQATGYNTMVFDFPQKKLFQTAFTNGSYSVLNKNKSSFSNSFRGQGMEKYAVTFIDNHDTFERSDNQGAEFLGYNSDLDNSVKRNRIIQANAYILMMPGVPCVFFPHWSKYKEQISSLIAIRKQAGIHSESLVTDEQSGQWKYSATIQGHRANVVLRLGANRSKEAPEGYHLALEGGSVSDYTIFISDNAQGMEDVNGGRSSLKSEKFVRDGKLLIRVGDKIYDVLGNMVE